MKAGMGGPKSEQVRRLVGCLFAGAIVAAPFLALTFDLTTGLVVMVCALAATAYLAWDAVRMAPVAVRRRLKIVAVANGVLAVLGVVVLVIRLA